AQNLVAKASGLFLWLRLACEKFEGSTGSILEMIENIPIGMEGIYDRAFEIGCEDLPVGLFNTVMGTIVTVEEPLSVSALSKLIERAEEDVRLVVNKLQSLLNVGNNEQVQVIHKSVKDYLTDAQWTNNSKKRVHIDIETTHHTLTLQCMTWMNKLLK